MEARNRIKQMEAHLTGTAASTFTSQQQVHHFGIDDMFREKAVDSPQLSPCGTRVVYTVTTTDRVADSSETALWVADTRTGAGASGGCNTPLRLTARGTNASLPRWSPDGSILAFLSSRSEPGSTDTASTQVWALRMAGGEAFKLTSLEGGVHTFSWSPDKHRPRLLLSTREKLETLKLPETDEDAQPAKAEPWVMDSLQFKQDFVGYLDANRGGVHLWVQEPAVPEEEGVEPEVRQITAGPYDEVSPSWSPDGTLVAFASNRTAEPAANTSSNIYVVHADNTDRGKTLVRVTAAEGSGDDEPAWSPDGQWIAYVTRPNADADMIGGSGFATPHLAVAPSNGSGSASVCLLTEDLDRTVSAPKWYAHTGQDNENDVNNGKIMFKVENSGRVELLSIRRDGSQLTRVLSGDYRVGALHTAEDAAVTVAVLSQPLRSSEIFVLEGLDGHSLHQLSHLNDPWLAELKLGTVEKISFRCKDTREYTHIGHQPIKLDTVNDTVEMFVHTPPGFQRDIGMKYPTLLWIHGGPVGQWDWGFSMEQHLFAGAGFVVLSVNPRGSSGRGQDFCQALFADWGGPALTDVLGAVDHAVAHCGCDSERLCVGGWSYGGILTNQIIVSNHRFKAAITGASALDYRAGYGHDQYQMLYEQELGLPWEHPETYDAITPFNHLGNVQTPTMIMCGEKDWNVPVQNSDQLYQALKRMGVPATLIVYPGQHHWVSEPSMEADIYERWLAWLDKWI